MLHLPGTQWNGILLHWNEHIKGFFIFAWIILWFNWKEEIYGYRAKEIMLLTWIILNAIKMAFNAASKLCNQHLQLKLFLYCFWHTCLSKNSRVSFSICPSYKFVVKLIRPIFDRPKSVSLMCPIEVIRRLRREMGKVNPCKLHIHLITRLCCIIE